ncbi:MAG: hypothetical protein KatS3mg092_0098 [Patescibacteria group bacterium]|nr:MAG: hypothetical protein KatS3mg092_0098 [Patescibacteria group bacterium]
MEFKQNNYKVSGRNVLSVCFTEEGKRVGRLSIDHYRAGVGAQIKLITIPEFDTKILDLLPLALLALGVQLENATIKWKKLQIRERNEKEIHRPGKITYKSK